ncbi:hypothetical protein HZ326_31492 [Fusarium oxysporum f. sp. albedinis]|nr:hypothetical protein HZ326_31492 [Fusarium oxysporum f. sp. albedinis]
MLYKPLNYRVRDRAIIDMQAIIGVLQLPHRSLTALLRMEYKESMSGNKYGQFSNKNRTFWLCDYVIQQISKHYFRTLTTQRYSQTTYKLHLYYRIPVLAFSIMSSVSSLDTESVESDLQETDSIKSKTPDSIDPFDTENSSVSGAKNWTYRRQATKRQQGTFKSITQ